MLTQNLIYHRLWKRFDMGEEWVDLSDRVKPKHEEKQAKREEEDEEESDESSEEE